MTSLLGILLFLLGLMKLISIEKFSVLLKIVVDAVGAWYPALCGQVFPNEVKHGILQPLIMPTLG